MMWCLFVSSLFIITTATAATINTTTTTTTTTATATTTTTTTAKPSPWIAEQGYGPWWHQRHEAFVRESIEWAGDIQAIFLGDSMMEGFSNTGLKVWNDHYEKRHAYNYAIFGDKTQNVLWRVQNGEFEHLKVLRLVVLMIGNDNLPHDKVDDIVHGINEILNALQQKISKLEANILLLSVLPRRDTQYDQMAHDINGKISKFANAQKNIYYHDLTATFESGLGKENPDLYIAGQTLLTAKAYEQWQQAIEADYVKLTAPIDD